MAIFSFCSGRNSLVDDSRYRLDQCIVEVDRAFRTLFGVAAGPAASSPGQDLAESDMSDKERRHAAALMRINHSGEVCAQALYSGQALTARNGDVQAVLKEAAVEETEHLAWTVSRVEQLGGRLSLLNPLFYAGAFAIGAVSGVLGDRWNLGFLAETERQVEAHLDGHLESLPEADGKSRAVVARMKEDEARHAETASEHGGGELPDPVKKIMKLAARAMTTATYRI
jgi:ubiquinone biosynthesis monooxygenase Coq7